MRHTELMAASGGRFGAIILAGGQSRRMGNDKGLVQLAPGEPCLVELVLAAVTPLVSSVVISTNRPADYAWLAWPLVGDNWPGAGPLAGLEAGLAASPTIYNLLVACDMPFIQPGLLDYLLTQAQDCSAVVPLNAAGQPEPLCAVYNRACLPVIRRQLERGVFKMSDWLSQVATRFVPASELQRFDPALRSFKNLNSPADIADVGQEQS